MTSTPNRLRLSRAILSLEGLSIGDAFGQQFFYDAMLTVDRRLPQGPWSFTDDTIMAIALTEILAKNGCIDQDTLADRFALRFRADPKRGYGKGAMQILNAIADGTPWRNAASRAFGGEGSKGNGAAMRAGPLGAFFADDIETVVSEAILSAEVTHAHPDGVAGAIAVAIAAATAASIPTIAKPISPTLILDAAILKVPAGPTGMGLNEARKIPFSTSVSEAAQIMGCGDAATSADTVPFSLWCAANCIDSFEDAMWTTVSALGDRDTTCAIVGSIVSLAVGRLGIPKSWRNNREPLPWALSFESMEA